MIKYFLSGSPGIQSALLPEIAALIDYRLLSMHKAFKGNTRVWCEVSHHKRSAMKEVMLDSGAFTAFMKGQKLTLEDLIAVYDDTIRKLNPKLKVWLINLDVIPGAPGRIASPTEIAQALDESDQNYRRLKKRYGTRVLPVYHQTEGEARLRVVAAMNDYIAMGFRQDFAEADRIQHAQEALAVIAPMGRVVHGLATTGYKMLARASFDSVDSATWLYIGAMGGIHFVDDKGELKEIAISTSSPRQRELRQHYNTLHPDEQKLIQYWAQKAGVTIEQVSSLIGYRIIFNAYQMREWLSNFKRPKVLSQKGLFPL